MSVLKVTCLLIFKEEWYLLIHICKKYDKIYGSELYKKLRKLIIQLVTFEITTTQIKGAKQNSSHKLRGQLTFPLKKIPWFLIFVQAACFLQHPPLCWQVNFLHFQLACDFLKWMLDRPFVNIWASIHFNNMKKR